MLLGVPDAVAYVVEAGWPHKLGCLRCLLAAGPQWASVNDLGDLGVASNGQNVWAGVKDPMDLGLRPLARMCGRV